MGNPDHKIYIAQSKPALKVQSCRVTQTTISGLHINLNLEIVLSQPAQSRIIPAVPSSFTYREYHSYADNLTNLWDSLKLKQFIASDTKLRDFKRIFSGNP